MRGQGELFDGSMYERPEEFGEHPPLTRDDYDEMLKLCDDLHELGQTDEACDIWEKYLEAIGDLDA